MDRIQQFGDRSEFRSRVVPATTPVRTGVALLSGAQRTLHTLWHLTPGQIYGRVLHELRQRIYLRAGPIVRWLYAPDPAARLAPVRMTLQQMDLSHHLRVAERWRRGRVEYVGSEGECTDWHARGRSRLWRYERQYHSELVALAASSLAEPSGEWLREALDLIDSWRMACPPGPGDAWEPYPVARRILNWSLSSALVPEIGNRLAPDLVAHLRFLRSHLERHLLGNHLLCDAAAMVAGSAMLDTPDAALFGAFGSLLLAAELRRQLLLDGGFAERTVHYHALVLRDVLLATTLAGLASRPVHLERELASMARWLSLVRRGDGGFPYLNDATPDAIFFAREALTLTGGSIPLGEQEHVVAPAELLLPQTGWSIIREDGHELLFEHGPIGPPEQPGHGHSDALSYELWWNGIPVVTDSGVTTYEEGPVRDFERSARAHATITVGGDGPDELWGSFRVGGRGHVEAGSSGQLAQGVQALQATVRAYGGWQHHRRLFFWPGKALVVIDRVRDARTGSEILSRMPLEPEWNVQPGLRTISLRHRSGLDLALSILQGEFAGASVGATEPREGWVSRGFGRAVARPSLRIRCDPAGMCSYVIAGPGVVVEQRGGHCTVRSTVHAIDIPLQLREAADPLRAEI